MSRAAVVVQQTAHRGRAAVRPCGRAAVMSPGWDYAPHTAGRPPATAQRGVIALARINERADQFPPPPPPPPWPPPPPPLPPWPPPPPPPPPWLPPPRPPPPWLPPPPPPPWLLPPLPPLSWLL